MLGNLRTFAILLAAVLAAVGARAETLDETDVRTAAVAFVNRDAIGASVLAGRQVASVTARDALWVVRLSPSGYIVFSGDTAAEPVVAFSANDYVEDSSSPLSTILDIADTNALAAAAREYAKPLMLLTSTSLATATSSATSSFTRRAAKWASLLGTANSEGEDIAMALASCADESTLTVQVKPFMTTKWNQWQPFNDYAPINPAASPNQYYRQRYYCGCVATAYAQILNYWKWPARFEEVVSFDHDVYDYVDPTTSVKRTMPMRIRFDGRADFDWTTMRDEYPSGSPYTGYDLRGKTNESLRYPVARLVMLSSVLAEMYYAPSGSGSIIETAVEKNPWYEMTNSVIRTVVNDDAAFFGMIRSDIQAGIPVGVTVPGHQIVAHGWAQDSDGTEYVYLNYGWSGSNDGYFNITETDADTTAKGYIDSALLGHTPVKTVQVDPLPTVSESSVTLNWHAPPRISDSFSGYDVRIKKSGTTPSNWIEDFSSHETATNSASGIFVGIAYGVSNTTPLLRVKSRSSGTFDLMDEKVLTTCSDLTYRYRYYCAIGLDVRLQARFNGGAWEDLDKPPLGTGYDQSGWKTRRIFLGDRANETMALRLLVTNNGYYISSTDTKVGVQLDDFLLADVLSFDETLVTCDKAARTATVDNLEAGTTYTFTVTPQCAGAKESTAVKTQIAGVALVPLAGEETYSLTNFTYAVGDANWNLSTQYYNTPSTTGGSSVTLGAYSGTLALANEWTPTEQGEVSFGWSAKNGSASVPDVLALQFTKTDGSVVTLWSVTNSANQASRENISVSLASVARECGALAFSFVHDGGNYAYAGYGATLYDVSVTGLATTVPPSEIAWGETTLVAEPIPSITGVTSISETSPAVQEGFYRECARGTNVFFVSCSENVTSLAARPSHLSLVPDSAVAVYPQGGGKFVVTVDGSGIDDDNDRSRMILTLVASDANGTTTARDLSLRFSKETAAETYEPPAEEKTTSTTPIPVPHAWLVEKGLVAEGSSDADFEAAADLDQDGDGQPTYAEYLCGTDPTDKNDVFKIFIEMVDGDPVISWSPTNAAASYTVEGKANLSDEKWAESNDSNRADLRFFRVRVVPK